MSARTRERRAASSDPTISREPQQFYPHRNGCRARVRLDCGCTGWCRCDFKANPTGKRVDAYVCAVAHLERLGLPAAPLIPEMRVLWRRGDRALAEKIHAATGGAVA